MTEELHISSLLVRSNPEQMEAVLAEIKSMAALEGLRVLVAEDNAVNRVLMEKFLQPTPAEVVFAENGREAVTQFEAFAPDIILMDMRKTSGRRPARWRRTRAVPP